MYHQQQQQQGKGVCFEPQPSLDLARFYLVFISLDLSTITFSQSKVISLACNPTLEGQVPEFMPPPHDRVAQFYPQAPGSLFVVFYDSQD
jgi:hypothetical protein